MKKKTDWNIGLAILIFLFAAGFLASTLKLNTTKSRLEEQHQALLDCTNQINELQESLDKLKQPVKAKPFTQSLYPPKWLLESPAPIQSPATLQEQPVCRHH